jgi:hypothetical protein
MLGRLFGGGGGGGNAGGASFVTGMVMNMAKSTLHLERDRPASHKGTKYGVAAVAGAAGAGTIEIADLPPVFDPQMATVMRCVSMILTPGIVIPKGHSTMIIPVGPTLQAWYHIGCQTPWKQQTHLAIVIYPKAKNTPTPPQLISSVAAHLVPHLTIILSDKIKDPGHRQCSVRHEQQHGGGCQILQCDMKFDPPDSPSARAATLFLYIQVAEEAPLGYRPVLIDGGVLTYVRSDKTLLIKEIQEWYKNRPCPKKNPIARRIAQNAHTHATSKLDMASRWRYDERTKGFYRPSTTRLAFMWPPSFATIKVMLILLIILAAAYIVGLNIIPSFHDPGRQPKRKPESAIAIIT